MDSSRNEKKVGGQGDIVPVASMTLAEFMADLINWTKNKPQESAIAKETNKTKLKPKPRKRNSA